MFLFTEISLHIEQTHSALLHLLDYVLHNSIGDFKPLFKRYYADSKVINHGKPNVFFPRSAYKYILCVVVILGFTWRV